MIGILEGDELRTMLATTASRSSEQSFRQGTQQYLGIVRPWLPGTIPVLPWPRTRHFAGYLLRGVAFLAQRPCRNGEVEQPSARAFPGTRCHSGHRQVLPRMVVRVDWVFGGRHGSGNIYELPGRRTAGYIHPEGSRRFGKIVGLFRVDDTHAIAHFYARGSEAHTGRSITDRHCGNHGRRCRHAHAGK